METKTMTSAVPMTMSFEHGCAMSFPRAARPILRDLTVSVQGTGVSSAALLVAGVRPEGDRAYVINPTFADGVGRSASWSPPV